MSRMLMQSIGTAGWVLLGIVLLPWAATAKPKEVIYAQCPRIFPNPEANGRKLRFYSHWIWDGIAIQEPNPDGKDYIAPEEDGWQMRCDYETGRQLTIPIPMGTTRCGDRGICMGPVPDKPLPPQQVFVAQPVDYSARWGGFGLRQTPSAILETVRAQGLTATAREAEIDGVKRVVEIDVTEKPFAIVFSPQTGLAREIVETPPVSPIDRHPNQSIA